MKWTFCILVFKMTILAVLNNFLECFFYQLIVVPFSLCLKFMASLLVLILLVLVYSTIRFVYVYIHTQKYVDKSYCIHLVCLSVFSLFFFFLDYDIITSFPSSLSSFWTLPYNPPCSVVNLGCWEWEKLSSPRKEHTNWLSNNKWAALKTHIQSTLYRQSRLYLHIYLCLYVTTVYAKRVRINS